MKKFLTVIALLGLFACSKFEQAPEAGSGLVEVRISATGELAAVKGSAPEDALYMVVVYSGSDASAAVDANRYAIGVFDDPAAIAVKLLAGQSYFLRVKAILDGVNVLEHDAEGMYAQIGHLYNRMSYFAADKTDAVWYKNVTSGVARVKGYGTSALDYPPIDTYYGQAVISPVEGQQTFELDLYRMVAGVKVTVNGLVEGDGTVEVGYYVGGNTKYTYGGTLSWDAPVYTGIHTYWDLLPAYNAAVAGSDYNSITMAISATYLAPDAVEARDLPRIRDMRLHRGRCNTVTINLTHSED